jgi:hypothetical protein
MPEILNINGFDSKNLLNPCEICTSCKGCKSCNSNMASNDPATQYQRQKIIQNTVRVKSSLYTMNLAALNVYQRPETKYNLVIMSDGGSSYLVSPGVNWNQMSDRKEPHIQVVKTGSGSAYGASSTKRSITRLRPGSLSPGGSGVDIKHNSYERYLNRIKGKGPVRRGVIPPTYGVPYIPFNRAFPIYGGKTIKTSIVSNCDCPITDHKFPINDKFLYQNSNVQDKIYDVTYTYKVGEAVWAKKNILDREYEKGFITAIDGGLYTVIFEDDSQIIALKCELLIYYDCNCCSNNNN